MNRDDLRICVRTRQMVDLRTCFPTLSERDLVQMLNAPAPRAVYILQQSFGCNLEEAKAAWNDYVLRYIDGQASGCEQVYGQAPQGSQLRMH